MIRWLRSLFAWRRDHTIGHWDYYENAVTGARKAVQFGGPGHSPSDWAWLCRLPPEAPVPPNAGSAVQ